MLENEFPIRGGGMHNSLKLILSPMSLQGFRLCLLNTDSEYYLRVMNYNATNRKV
mgnify:CR=1 FL=1